MEFFTHVLGIDWATSSHQCCIVREADRKRISERVIDHTHNAVQELIGQLRKEISVTLDGVAVAIERPDGPLVEAFLDAGIPVYHIHPTRMADIRTRYTLSGAKDDKRDAFMIGDSFFTDRQFFRLVQASPGAAVQLRDLSRRDAVITSGLLQSCNQLREQIGRSAPHLLELSPSASGSWFWEIVKLAITPDRRAMLTVESVESIMRQHHIRRYTPEAVLEIIRRPAFPVSFGVMDSVAMQVEYLTATCQLWWKQHSTMTQALNTVLGQFSTEQPSVEIVLSFPGIGVRTAAVLLGESWQAVASYDYAALRALSGVAPVTKQSGQTRYVVMRRSCNHALRSAMYHVTRIAMQRDHRYRAIYQRSRQRGCGHNEALRILGDKMLRQLCHCLEHGTPYNPNPPIRI